MFRCLFRTGRILRILLFGIGSFACISFTLLINRTFFDHSIANQVHDKNWLRVMHHMEEHSVHNEHPFKNIIPENKPIVLGNSSIRNGGKLVDNLAYQANGAFKFPSNDNSAKLPLFPFETNDTQEDRIWNQMRYVPKHIAEGGEIKEKIILFYNGMGVERGGREGLKAHNCPVQACLLTADRSLFSTADVVLWQYSVSEPFQRRPPNQIWGVFFLESPHHTQGFTLPGVNWTMTYMRDSTIVTPYFKFSPWDQRKSKFEGPHYLPPKNYAQGKNKKVAWFVSNCGAPNQRSTYVAELQKYIEVDIYGACGNHHCPRSNEGECFNMLRKEYKFYLAFENSNCRDYITEKLFKNALQNDIVPIVMGAHPEDYRRQAPFHSYIHIDEFTSPEELAKYLHYLNSNDTAYNTYFSWKGSGLVDTNTFFICRLCMMAHEADYVPQSTFHGAGSWWRNSCINTNRWMLGQTAVSRIESLKTMSFLHSTGG